MNAYGFLLYVIVDRVHLIRINEDKIIQLKQKLDSDESYQKCLEVIQKAEKKRQLIEKRLTENSGQDRENRIILDYSNQIQMLTDAIAEKEQKIRLIRIMLDVLENKKKLNYISLFTQFYQQNRQIALEELNEDISIGRQSIQFISLLHSIFKKQRQYSATTLQARLMSLLVYYETIQQELLQEKEKKQTRLQKTVQVKRNYPKMRQKLETNKHTLDMILEQANQLNEQIQKRRTSQQNEMIRLEQVNRKYYEEIESLISLYNNSESFLEGSLMDIHNSLQYKAQGGRK